MTTTQDIHGHEVLHLILEARPALTREGLIAAVQQRYGAAARFCTCSTANMTLAELLAFLEARGKFAEHQGRIVADPAQMCSHDH